MGSLLLDHTQVYWYVGIDEHQSLISHCYKWAFVVQFVISIFLKEPCLNNSLLKIFVLLKHLVRVSLTGLCSLVASRSFLLVSFINHGDNQLNLKIKLVGIVACVDCSFHFLRYRIVDACSGLPAKWINLYCSCMDGKSKWCLGWIPLPCIMDYLSIVANNHLLTSWMISLTALLIGCLVS